MGDYHYIYKDLDGASTQWDDIQAKLGNLPPKKPAFKPPPFTPAEDEASLPKDKSWIDDKTEQDLEDLEDDPDLDDDRFLEEYRRKRLSELREAAKVARFGSVVPISGSDFVREVSQAPPDVWVVVILYKEGIAECGLLMQCLEDLATKYPATKFVKIISTDCIPNYPDRNLPTLLVYNSGAVKANHVGLRSFGRRCTPEGSFLLLNAALILLFPLHLDSLIGLFDSKNWPSFLCNTWLLAVYMELLQLHLLLMSVWIIEHDFTSGGEIYWPVGFSIDDELLLKAGHLNAHKSFSILLLQTILFIDTNMSLLQYIQLTSFVYVAQILELMIMISVLFRLWPCVALVLCQSDPVLNDGQSVNGRSREAVKRFIEKVVTQHEDKDDGYSSD
ncbi:putative thioredoxin-like protein [Rosa chinensis]|uniref:Putative thioredoxin-like protein n=1 Tax=Rosa chinensis TaxID=74649 RepID=A0A2P6RCW2_ROSCH|nr:putative thioredoxin-like protein [Rosa chinensis]